METPKMSRIFVMRTSPSSKALREPSLPTYCKSQRGREVLKMVTTSMHRRKERKNKP